MIEIQFIISSFFIFFIFSMIIVIRSLIVGYEFNEYLKKNYYSRWREITSFDKVTGPGMNNPFKNIPYIYGNEDNDDEKILRYKDRIKIYLRWAGIFFFICFSHIITLFFLAE